ncbi:MAG: hypothetical protein JNL61_06075 [Rhizobiaceae bacterium]|nr:hypothetical protein [Rhizobiaceae bacterium]
MTGKDNDVDSIAGAGRHRFARTIGEGALALVLALASVAFLTRSLASTGFTHVSADDLDGALQLALLEHWHNVLTGAGTAPWNAPNFFYPVPDTLGYNDGYLLFGIVFTAWRGIGIDPMLAQEFTHFVFRIAGFLGLWVLVRRCFGGSVPAAAFAAILFTLASVNALSLLHSQLTLVGLTPWALVLAGLFLEAVKDGRAGKAFACLAGLSVLTGCWILSGFYTVWFTAVLMLFGAIVILLVWRPVAMPYLRAIRQPRMLAATAAGAAVSLPFIAGFLKVYAPKLRETGGHDAGVTLEYIPRFPQDLVNLGSHNVVWSRTLDPLYGLLSGGESLFTNVRLEPASSMFTPILMICLAIAALRFQRWAAELSPGARAAIGAGLAGAFFFYFVDFQVGGWSPWLVVAKIIPGASGLRVIPRFNLVLLIPASVGLALWLQHDVARRRRFLAVLIAAAILVEQTSNVDLKRMQRGTVEAFLAEVGSPPAGCEAFYAVHLPESSPFWPGVVHDEPTAQWMAADMPAMLVAAAVHLPTLNGHASFLPRGWFLKKPSSDDYIERVHAFAREHGVGPLCVLDLTTRDWMPDLVTP